MTDSIELYGNAGTYIMDGNVLSFQIGEGKQVFGTPGLLVPQGRQLLQYEHQWLKCQWLPSLYAWCEQRPVR